MATIVRYEPFEELTRLQRDVARLFDDSLRAPSRSHQDGGSQIARATWAPVVDVHEDVNEVVVHADLPGVNQENIDIQVAGDTLILRGERKFEEHTETKTSYVRIERAYGSFQRTFTIGVPVDADKVTASFKDGVLSIHLPKSEATKPMRVAVSTS